MVETGVDVVVPGDGTAVVVPDDGELAGAAVVVPGDGVVVVSDDGEFSSWLVGLGEPT